MGSKKKKRMVSQPTSLYFYCQMYSLYTQQDTHPGDGSRQPRRYPCYYYSLPQETPFANLTLLPCPIPPQQPGNPDKYPLHAAARPTCLTLASSDPFFPCGTTSNPIPLLTFFLRPAS